ncbi:MAG: DNA adenine methylase [Bacteroidales bacterium]|nr:DNA adenine methylase [Bacteroidales bacterium]MCM1148358.1 DNA adenine methylase [Bacteroidales bacterium]MCM1207031.1 DNA adenine methylase [Bacillota bacterium]MCM1511301.1 DNA adenine methylase [Clostridium sp.]
MTAKPFIKWVGGKSQLIGQLDALLPDDFGTRTDATYIEPFVGGGAMLFHILQKYPNIRHAVINDINLDLVTCYRTVRDRPEELILSLQDTERHYKSLHAEEERREFFLGMRKRYNEKGLSDIENTTKFIFLNRTCFNGLYRVNKSGAFNVPFGKYANPTICDADTIRADSNVLQRVEIINGDFEDTFRHAQGNTLFYFDPPYRPLSSTSNFKDYTTEPFNDDSQRRLKTFCDKINDANFHFMLSNSDCKGVHETIGFFDSLYSAYSIKRVWASRHINSNPDKRGKLTEILVRNYTCTKEYLIMDNITSDSHCAAENPPPPRLFKPTTEIQPTHNMPTRQEFHCIRQQFLEQDIRRP